MIQDMTHNMDKNIVRMTAMTARIVLTGLILLLTGGNATADTSDGPTIGGSVYGGGNLADVGGSVTVNMQAGIVTKDVYGGGALANTNNFDTNQYDEVKGLSSTSIVTGLYTKEGDIYKEVTTANQTAQTGTVYYRKGKWVTTLTNNTTTVNLLGGRIHGDAYGGGLGRIGITAVEGVHYTQEEIDAAQAGDPAYGKTTNDWKVAPVTGVEAKEATVYGDINVYLGGDKDGAAASATAFTIGTYDGTHSGVVKSGRVFGCNNLNGSPQGNVTVTVYKTVKGSHDKTPAIDGKAPKTVSSATSYRVAAVYGGGNLANYAPTATGKKSHVIINGCSDTSIEYVYGGGNAAAVPETDVDVIGAYEIGAVFGGGNGKDQYTLDGGSTWKNNAGANVNGNANTMLYGGMVHEAFGGSNEKGTIMGNVAINTSKTGGECTLCVGTIYGAGKNADIEGDLIMILGCKTTETEAVYGGAENANVKGKVELTITSGKFGKVFGGNNTSGAIFGSITLNIMESGCSPIEIDELYGGGYLAAYSIYGYYVKTTNENGIGNVGETPDMKDGKLQFLPRVSADDTHLPVKSYRLVDPVANTWTWEVYPITGDGAFIPYKDPVVNIVAATSIGKVFGGGYGEGAVIYGSPTVNINQAYPLKFKSYTEGTTTYEVRTETLGEIGTDGVFGGGNQAKVVGNTTINIGTEQTVDWTVLKLQGDGDPVLDDEDKVIPLEIKNTDFNTVRGANIAGNVYGGGNEADVTGNTFVNVCAKKGTGDSYTVVAEGSKGVTIAGNIYGGGKGVAEEGDGAESFQCLKAMVGTNNAGENEDYADGNTTVVIGHGTVGTLNSSGALVEGTGNVYGGGEVGRMEGSAVVKIGLGSGSSDVTNDTRSPVIHGSVFGAGSGINTHGYSALVRGNSTVTVEGDAWVKENVYGGGETASVGRYHLVTEENKSQHPGLEVGEPYELWYGGKSTVTVQGYAKVGPTTLTMPTFYGNVFGAGKGVLPYENMDSRGPGRVDTDGNWESYATDQAKYFEFIRSLALNNNTEVIIAENAFIKGSVYGGSQNGRVREDTDVKIQGGQIGCGYDGSTGGAGDLDRPYTTAEWAYDVTTDQTKFLNECHSWPYGRKDSGDTEKKYLPYDPYASATDAHARPQGSDGHTYYGNVFGGGSGKDPYAIMSGTTVSSHAWLDTAGEVGGDTKVTITGGHILTSVYGGNELTEVKGDSCVVIMSGGTLGVPRTLTRIAEHPVVCNLYGAGKGDQRTIFNTKTNVENVRVHVGGTARIYGTVFGGGEDGHVHGNVKLGVFSSNCTIGTWGTSYLEGNVFGGGRGFSGEALTAGVVQGNVDITIENGNILGSVYGGGRLASVGTYLVPADNANYGNFLPESEAIDPVYYTQEEINNAQEGDPAFGKTTNDIKTPGVAAVTHGHITINISGGTIGNTHEYKYYTFNVDTQGKSDDQITVAREAALAALKAEDYIPNTVFEYSDSVQTENTRTYYTRLSHTKGGNVFAGCMGRLYMLDGTSVIPRWTDMAKARTTEVNISGTAKIKSNVYGGAELGSLGEEDSGSYVGGSDIEIAGGTIGQEIKESVTTGEGESATTTDYTHYTFGSVFGGGYGSTIEDVTDTDGNTTHPKLLAGIVKGATKIDISGADTQIWASVYGGGEVASIQGNAGDEVFSTDISIRGGKIGKDKLDDDKNTTRTQFGGVTMGNVYGGGKGYKEIVRAGQIKGNTKVTVSGGTIYHNIYGGGAYGTVGDFQFTYSTSLPGYSGKSKVNGINSENPLLTKKTGKTVVTVTGGTIGVDGIENGMVFGSSRGDVGEQRDLWMAWVYDTNVVIGTDGGGDDDLAINGSVYGSGENGHVYNDTDVKIYSGTIGIHDGSTWDKTRGNVYGGGCGEDEYPDDTEVENMGGLYEPSAGIVYGDANVTMSGGLVLHNIYGAGALGSVGMTKDENNHIAITSGGKTTIEINGGIVGVDGNDNGYVFGAARGDGKSSQKGIAQVKETSVTISQADGKTTMIYGNVYGGGETGDVGTYTNTYTTTGSKNYVWDKIDNKEIGGCSVSVTGGQVKGNVFGAGKGVDNSFECEKAIVRTATVSVSAGTVNGNVYGGGEVGRVDQNTKVTIGAETATAGTSAPIIAGDVFGAGAGKETHGYSALVRGDAEVIIQGNAEVGKSVYGGGEIAAVGRYGLDSDNMPTTLVSGGECKVTVKGSAKIGPANGGNVFGACKGVNPFDDDHAYIDFESNNESKWPKRMTNKPGEGKAWPAHYTVIAGTDYIWEYYTSQEDYFKYLQTLALATDTKVSIEGSATVKGSVYGGSESGFVQRDTEVKVLSGEIGIADAEGTITTEGNIYGGGKGLSGFDEAGRVSGGVTIAVSDGKTHGDVYGGGELGIVKGAVLVNILGGTVDEDVYGGGALANTNTNNWDGTDLSVTYQEVSGLTAGTSSVAGYYTKSGETYTLLNSGTAVAGTKYYRKVNTTVNLLGGTIKGDAYGGGLGQKKDFNGATTDITAVVYGDISVTLDGTRFEINKYTDAGYTNVVKSGRVFGCNNLNGSPQGDVTVTVNQTVAGNVSRTDPSIKVDGYGKKLLDDPAYQSTYEVAAVYGGGNLAPYKTTGKKTHVIINGCGKTSIETVYGGGNAAAVPESKVDINGTYEIGCVFGGGNGKDRYWDGSQWVPNPGANVGKTIDGEIIGNGNTTTWIYGGTIHEAYGASNEKGTITGNVFIDAASVSTTDVNYCKLDVGKMVGAGKNADVNGDIITILGCKPDELIPIYYGGADNANVNGNVELTITSGKFGQVFGGNNLGGAIRGHIIVNIEEITPCSTPIVIDKLYLGGNRASYSRYGYYVKTTTSEGPNASGVGASTETAVLTTGDNPKLIFMPRTSTKDLHLPVDTYWYDEAETDPTKKWKWTTTAINAFTPYDEPQLNVISCTSINEVFGGGYGVGGDMYANPTVNINMIKGTMYSGVTATTENPNQLGVIGTVYGGGDAADVLGSTTVNIGTEPTVDIFELEMEDGAPKQGEGGAYIWKTTKKTETVLGAYISGNVFGGGKGQADSFACSKAMIGKDGAGESDDYTDGNTNVNIGNGTVMGNVYGGGEIGRVERNTTVTIGLPDAASGESKPDIKGSVFGGGKGKDTHGYAALVRGNPTVIIQADAKVEHNVYGGGEIASVARYKVAQDADEAAAHGVGVDMPYALANTTSGNCHVTVKDRAVIGPDTPMKMYHEGVDPAIDAPDDAGHVFGAGKGILPDNYTYADISHKPKRMVLRDETIHTDDKMGTDWEYVDPSDNNNNNVWEYFANRDAYIVFIQTLALSSYANVTIGETNSTNAPFVKGSVYGGSENGLVQFNTNVYIKSGQIGWGKYAQDNNQGAYGDDVWLDTYEPLDAIDLECPHWVYGKVEGTKTIYAPYDPNANASGDLDKYPPLPGQTVGKSTEGGRRVATDGHTYYGNVFGGGSGSVPYFDTSEGISKYLNTAGTVKGNTYVEITGGHILTNVYGGCEATNVLGKATVKMTGGTLGVPRTEDQIRNHPVTCYLFGAGKGDQRIFFNKDTNVNDAEVEVDGGRVYGSVFGGGEDGHVMRHSLVTIKQSLGKTTKIGTTGNTYVDGNIFGGGRGFGGDALTAGNVGGCVEVNIEGGTMLGSIYGGGRLASVGYGLYLATGAEAAKYGEMRADNEYDDPDNPISKTQDAQAFFAVNPFTGKAFTSTGRGKITINIKGGTIGNDVVGAQYGGNVFGGSMGRLTKLDGTPNSLWDKLATAKTTTVNVTGGNIYRSVYGGGEMGTVTEDATVTVSGGIIGIEGNGGVEFGNVYGGGKGYFDKSNLNNATYVLAGIVKGNTNVNINNGTIYHNIYGGGAYGSVGDITLGSATYVPGLSSVTMMPVSWTRKNGDTGKNTGTTTVTIKGGNIGIDGHENGMIFGSSRGEVSAPGEIHDHMAWVYDTHVVIGGDDSDPLIKGSVYGGGENGHVFVDAEVKVHSGTVGMTDDPTYPNRGNVYGAGCGTDTYTGTDSKTYFNPLAGIVLGNTTVEMDGGRVIRTIYGGGAMGSVGTYTYNDAGKPTACKDGTGLCIVNISGGKIGPETMVMPNNYGNVFGAGRGEMHDLAEYPNLEKMAYFNKTEVTISGSALVKGSVYGGSESGHVLGNTKVIVSGGQIGCGNGKDAAYTDEEWSAADPATLLPVPSWTYTENGYAYDKFAGTEAGKEDKYPDGTSTEGGRRVATDGHTFYGNVFGGGSGYEPYAAGKWLETAGRVEGQTEVEITGGHILSNVYGGNECTDVLGTCTVTMSDGTVGVPYPATGFNPALGHLFGAGKGDKRIFFNTWTNVKQATVSVSGGRVFGSVYGGGEDGHVGFEGDTGGYDGDAETTISGDAHIGTNGNSGYDGNVFGGGQGSLTALTAGVVQGNVTLNIEDGQIDGSVYGGGRLASVGTHLVPVNSPVYGELQNDDNHGNIKINLTGGTINQDVFGGSMGSTMSVSYPNEKSNADMGISRDVTVELNKSIAANTDGCVVNGSIFGCNNANGTPKGHSTVHIFRTAGSTKDPTVPVSNRTSYDVAAVYGGGKSADYVPASTDTKQSSEVIIEGCDLTSIKEVYGGGYGAATPGTNVLIKGTYIINNVFGGGFGADDPSISYVNPGANVGYLTDGTEYGAADGGKAVVQLMAGTVNHVYGGSNSKGNIRGGSNVTSVARGPGDTTPNSCTELNVQEIFGGGKNADMFGGTEIVLGCMPNDWIGAIYAGAENADVHNDVSLTLTSGKFERVFGGNKSGGRLNGGIEVNIEESGTCGTPIIIGELYGGGNEAPYSIYGYKDEKDSDGKWIPRLKADYDALTDAQKEAEGIKSGPNHDPVVNVKAFTSIGNIFGGGYGQTAKVVGNPIVNINEVKISHTDTDDAFEGNKYTGETKELKDDNGVTTNVVIYPHEDGEIGVIGNVFGGGNAAEVIGNTNVNIGTEAEVGFESLRTSEGVPTKPVVGADIRGNVYGGGNNAGVTGDTNVVIGKEKVTTP